MPCTTGHEFNSVNDYTYNISFTKRNGKKVKKTKCDHVSIVPSYIVCSLDMHLQKLKRNVKYEYNSILMVTFVK